MHKHTVAHLSILFVSICIIKTHTQKLILKAHTPTDAHTLTHRAMC